MSRRSLRTPRLSLRSIWAAVAASLATAGLALVAVAWASQQHAPQPPPAEAGTYALNTAAATPAPRSTPANPPTNPPTASPAPSPTTVGPILPAATPTHLSIPAIGIDSDLLTLGLNPDGSVQVPPLEKNSRAGWYDGSPTPGTLGPAVILGHIDSAKYGPGVFFRLGALKPGDTISVTRSDATVATFRVDAVAEYPKARFPTTTVYGNTTNAALRLITCGGKFDFSERSYQDNIVAFASLISAHRL